MVPVPDNVFHQITERTLTPFDVLGEVLIRQTGGVHRGRQHPVFHLAIERDVPDVIGKPFITNRVRQQISNLRRLLFFSQIVPLACPCDLLFGGHD